jgi:hypothetical protein
MPHATGELMANTRHRERSEAISSREIDPEINVD